MWASRHDLGRALPLWADGGVDGRHVLAVCPDALERIQVVDDRARLASTLRAFIPPAGDARLPLVVVALAYDAGRALEDIGPGPDDDLGLPELVVARFPGYLVAPRERGPWTAVGDVGPLLARLASAAAAPATQDTQPRLWMSDPRPFDDYRVGIEAVLEHIRAGDLYQANIARRLVGDCHPRAVPELYAALRQAQPNRFGALWGIDDGAWLASNSPECLLRWDGATRIARSFPIKGTRARGACEDADRAAIDALQASAKDRAEHVMIVDLVRNDLGRVAALGSVRVEALYDVMTLTTVHHLVSTVACRVRADQDLVDLVFALFPGGSITGAPKIAAMRLIDQVEPQRRGFYCGTIGVCFGGAEAVFSILIRTLVAARGRISYATGGGIVADSDAQDEWAETEAKARALMVALAR